VSVSRTLYFVIGGGGWGGAGYSLILFSVSFSSNAFSVINAYFLECFSFTSLNCLSDSAYGVNRIN